MSSAGVADAMRQEEEIFGKRAENTKILCTFARFFDAVGRRPQADKDSDIFK